MNLLINNSFETNPNQACHHFHSCIFLLLHHSKAWSFKKTTAMDTLSSTLTFKRHSNCPFPPQILFILLVCQAPIKSLTCLLWPTSFLRIKSNTLHYKGFDYFVLNGLLFISILELFIHGVQKLKYSELEIQSNITFSQAHRCIW